MQEKLLQYIEFFFIFMQLNRIVLVWFVLQRMKINCSITLLFDVQLVYIKCGKQLLKINYIIFMYVCQSNTSTTFKDNQTPLKLGWGHFLSMI